MALYECRSCGILTTERKDRCPACHSRHGNIGNSGTPFRRVDAKDLLGHLE